MAGKRGRDDDDDGWSPYDFLPRDAATDDSLFSADDISLSPRRPATPAPTPIITSSARLAQKLDDILAEWRALPPPSSSPCDVAVVEPDPRALAALGRAMKVPRHPPPPPTPPPRKRARTTPSHKLLPVPKASPPSQPSPSQSPPPRKRARTTPSHKLFLPAPKSTPPPPPPPPQIRFGFKLMCMPWERIPKWHPVLFYLQ